MNKYITDSFYIVFIVGQLYPRSLCIIRHHEILTWSGGSCAYPNRFVNGSQTHSQTHLPVGQMPSIIDPPEILSSKNSYFSCYLLIWTWNGHRMQIVNIIGLIVNLYFAFPLPFVPTFAVSICHPSSWQSLPPSFSWSSQQTFSFSWQEPLRKFLQTCRSWTLLSE